MTILRRLCGAARRRLPLVIAVSLTATACATALAVDPHSSPSEFASETQQPETESSQAVAPIEQPEMVSSPEITPDPVVEGSVSPRIFVLSDPPAVDSNVDETPTTETPAPTDDDAAVDVPPVEVATVAPIGSGAVAFPNEAPSDNAQIVANSHSTSTVMTGRGTVIDDQGRLVVRPASVVEVEGIGFVPGTVAEVWLFSEPTKLGDVTVKEDGSFAGFFSLPSGVTPGDHTLKTFGELDTGDDVFDVPVLVAPDTPAPDEPQPAVLTFTDGAVRIDYVADELWLRLNGEWITASVSEPIELAPGDTLKAQVRNCDDAACSDWVYSEYTAEVAASPDAPVISFAVADDGYSGEVTITSDAEEVLVTVDGEPVADRSFLVTDDAMISAAARNCGVLPVCSDWVLTELSVVTATTPEPAVITFASMDAVSGTVSVMHDADEVVTELNGDLVEGAVFDVGGLDELSVAVRNCVDLCSEWVDVSYVVSEAPTPEAPSVEFVSLTAYTGQLEIDYAADEVVASLNGEDVLAGIVAVAGGDVFEMRIRNCGGADVCSPWVEAQHVVSVDAAPDAPVVTFTATGPYSGELGYTATGDEYSATFNGVDVELQNFAVYGGETLAVQARNCADAETCSEWVTAEHTVTVADTPDAAVLIYSNEFLDIVHDADEMELSTDGGSTYNLSAAVSWGVNVGDTVDVRVRNCGTYDICSIWAYSDYEVTQADEPAAASIVFNAIDSYTGELDVDHSADEAVMTLDGEVVTGTITAVGHQELVVNIRDCDDFDVCSEWVETRYTVSVAATPTAADISFARTTDFTGELEVTHFAQEEILDLDGDTTVTSPVAVNGLETLNANIRNCADADVCSPWVPSTHEVTVAPVPDAPAIGFTTTGATSRNLGVTTDADKYEARLNNSVVTLPVTVTGGETLVVEAWNCDNYDICSNPASSIDTHIVSVAPTPDAAELTYDNGKIDIGHSANQMELSTDGGSTYNLSAAVSWGVNVGDTVDVRVRNCGTYDICSIWAYSDYEVTQADEPAAATFQFESTGDYSADITIGHNAENVEVAVDGEIFEGLVVPVNGGEVISVDVWDCGNFDECSTKANSTYTVDVATSPDAASIDFTSTGSYEDSGTLTITQGDAEEMRQWFNNESTNNTSFAVTGGETLLVEVRNCGTATQICSPWIPTAEFVVTVDGAAPAAILAFSKVDDDNGTIAVTDAADQIRLVRDGVTLTGLSDPVSVAVTAGQTLVAETRNCLNGRLCSAWTSSTYTVSTATQPAAPTLTFASVDAYNGTVNIEAAAYQDRIEATLTRGGTSTSETLPLSVVGLDVVTVKVRGCDDGDLCSPWSTNTYTVSQAASTNTPTITPTRIGGNFDSISTSVAVDFGTVEELQIFADSTSGTLLSDSTATVTIAKADGHSSLVARSRNCSGSDVCSPWVDATMNVTTRANPAAPVITLDENGFVVSALGEFDRYELNSAAFVEASGNLTSVPAGDNDTLTVETRNCGDVNTWTFCSDIVSEGPALYVPAPQEATLTWDTSDYLLEVDFDATHIKIETGQMDSYHTLVTSIYISETTYTKAEFEAEYPNGINCRPGWTGFWDLDNCWMDIEVWNESGSYSSLAVPSGRFTLNQGKTPKDRPFTPNVDVETGEVLSIDPRVTPTDADIIVNFTGGGLTLAGPFTCEDDWTCPALFDNIVGNSYPAGATFSFGVENWTDGLNDVHLPGERSTSISIYKTDLPTTSFGTLNAGLTGIAQPFSVTPATQFYVASSGTHKFEYSVDGGTTWVALPDVAGGSISTNLAVGYDVLYPGNDPVPSLDFRARYCADSQDPNNVFLCSDWSTVKSYTQADLTADNPAPLTLHKMPEWTSGWHYIFTPASLAPVKQFRVDNDEWSDDWFGGHNSNSHQSGWIDTPGSYQSRQQNCGMAAGGCSSGGTNVFPSEWVYADIEITQTPAPTVVLQPNTTGHTGANTCLETYKNGTAVEASGYTIDDGSTIVDENSSSCIGGFSDGDQVIAYVHHYDSSYDLGWAEETASAVYTVSQADHPDITVNIDPLTGSTTLSSSTGSDVTFAYAIDNWNFTDYSSAFTVEADDDLRVRAYNCQPDKTLCGYTYEEITPITQAGTVPAAQLWFDIAGGSNDFAVMYLDADPNYILTSFKVNSVEYVLSGPVACVAEPSGIDPNTCLTNLDTTLGFGELMPGDALEYTLYNLGDAHLAGAATTSTVTPGAHSKDSLSLGTGETTADGFKQTLTGGWSETGTLYGAFQYSTDGSNWTALPIVSTTTSSVADFVAEVPNSALSTGSDIHIRFRTCYSSSSDGYTFHFLATSDLCTNWQPISYTQAELTGAAVAAPSLAWNNSTQTIDITNPADDVQYSTDGVNWTDTAFGTITTAGTYHVRHRWCGTANDASCATGGMNAYPSAWMSASYTVTQAAQPSVGITVSQSTEKATINASAGTVTYDIDGGTENSYSAPFAVTANTTVNATAQDCSLDLCSSTGTYSLPITRNSDPVLSVSINQDTGVTTVSYGTSTNTTYDLGSGATTYNDTPFTVVKDTDMTVTAVDCSGGNGVLCSGTSTVSKTITQAAAPTVEINIDVESGAVSLSPSADATETEYDIGSGYVAYSSSFTPANGTVVNASARNCSTVLCSLPGTDSLTVTYGTTPTVTIAMDDSGNLVITTDTATADTQIRYGWATGDTTNTYSAPLTTSYYSFGATLYVEARSKDGANVWSSWSAEQSFDTMGATVSAAVTTTPNSDWTEMTFTSTGNDIEYKVLSSYDNTGVTGDVWTEGANVAIRDNSNGYIDPTASGADGTADHNYNMSIAVISTRARDCVNVNVEGSCSSWVEEVGVTYGNETMPFPAAADRAAQNSDGDIYTTFTTECDFDRCMPIVNISWWFDVDQLTEGNDGSDLQASHTFVSSRSDNSYVEATSGVEVGTGIVTAVAGQVVSGDLGASFGIASIDTAGKDMEPRVCIKRLWFSVAWSGSAAGWSTVAAKRNNPGRSELLC